MKKSSEIMGLPVISINEGRELGKVRDLVINPAAKAVSALLIEDRKWFMGAKTCPFSAISGIGQDALTIETSQSVTAALDSPELLDLLAEEIRIIGSKLLTKTGQLQGKIVDMIVDESGKMISFDVEGIHGRMTNILSDQVLTFGRKVTITNEDIAVEIAPADISNCDAAATVMTDIAIHGEGTGDVMVQEKLEQDPSAAEVTKKLEDRQKKYLIGKKVNRQLETDRGTVIIEQDGVVTEEVIQKAKLAGKFVELSMSI